MYMYVHAYISNYIGSLYVYIYIYVCACMWRRHTVSGGIVTGFDVGDVGSNPDDEDYYWRALSLTCKVHSHLRLLAGPISTERKLVFYRR